MTIDSLPSVPLYVLNRLALAVIAVVRYHTGSAVIASFEATLVPSALSFSERYNRVGLLKAEQAKAVRTSGQLTAQIYKSTQAWFGRVVADLPDLELRGFGSQREVTLDVLTDARRLVEAVQTLGERLPYAQKLVESVGSLADATATAYDHAQVMRRALQQLQSETRETGAVLNQQIIAFRRTVRAELGWKHVDYQRLRIYRGQSEVVEEEAATEAQATMPGAVALVAAPPLAAPGNGHSKPPSLA